jgi:membrane protein
MNAFSDNVHRLPGTPRARARVFDTLGEWVTMVRQTVTAWLDDYAPSMGAAIAYYTVFSIAPLLIMVIAIAGRIFGADAVQGQVVAQLQGLIGADAAQVIQGLIADASRPQEGLIAGCVGSVLLIIGATSVLAELQDALDRIWKMPAVRNEDGWLQLLRTRLLSFGVVLALGFLLVVSLVISVAIAALGTWWSSRLAGWETILHALNLAVGFALTTGLFATIYKLMPRARVAWKDVWIGAAVTALLFEIGKLAIGLYIGKSAVASSFGAAGSLVALLIWVYYSAQIFLLGAEFTWVYAHHGGSRAGRPLPQLATAQGIPQRPRSA